MHVQRPSIIAGQGGGIGGFDRVEGVTKGVCVFVCARACVRVRPRPCPRPRPRPHTRPHVPVRARVCLCERARE